MGFMDGFTSDGTVDMKHTEYYNLMREAAKAELIGNAVKADVPGFYIQAMITGKKPEFLNTLDAEEESTGFHAEYEQITGAVVTIFEAWMKENGVESTAASLHRLIDTLAKNRIEELQTIKVNQEEHREQIKAAFEEMEKTMGAMAKMPPITVCMDFGSKKDQAAAVEPKESKTQAVDCWSCDTCGHHTGLKCDADICKECEELNMVAELQTVSREACTAMIEHAYAMGYMDAKERERKRKKALREKRERKKYFITQKLYGVAVLFLTVVAVKLLDGDATIALFTVPLGVTLIASKEMLIINEYYWKCEEENGICN